MFKLLKKRPKWLVGAAFGLSATALAVFIALSFTQKYNPTKNQAVTSDVVIEETEIETVTSVPSITQSVEEPISSTETSSKETTPPPPKVKVINAYLPYQKQSYAAGSTFEVIISAPPDSTRVEATFNGQTIRLEMQPYANSPEFVNFAGHFTLPEGNEENLSLGKVKYFAEWNGHTDTYYSPTITCLRDPACDRTTVVEVIAESAETFSGDTTDDKSDPRLSPLPKGTVDYKVGGVIYDKESEKYYYKLRCGRRVYVDKPNPPSSKYQVTTTYKGELPDTNKVALNEASVSGGYTYMEFSTEWKAPFAVTVAPQEYTRPSIYDFTVASVTSRYVDIKFYYANTVSGDLNLPENPLFSRAEVIAQEGGAVLRLHLKKTGGFYGWNAYYNSDEKLEFKFLNPKKATVTSNRYGADLSGITVMLDAGHGGRDPGAIGGKNVYEAERNLALVYKIKAELECTGATVVLTRTNDTEMSAESRCSIMRNKAPDLCVSIHHNASSSPNPNGADFYCFNAYSYNAMQSLFLRTNGTDIYKKVEKGWHYFFMGRVTSCPLVLIESGYMSNSYDLDRIVDENINKQKAVYITQGIADYFLSIN